MKILIALTLFSQIAFACEKYEAQFSLPIIGKIKMNGECSVVLNTETKGIFNPHALCGVLRSDLTDKSIKVPLSVCQSADWTLSGVIFRKAKENQYYYEN